MQKFFHLPAGILIGQASRRHIGVNLGLGLALITKPHKPRAGTIATKYTKSVLFIADPWGIQCDGSLVAACTCRFVALECAGRRHKR
jgi:hypothetical protein